MKKYQNELLGLSRTEIQNVWNNVWNEIQKLNPLEDTEKLVELNRKFDKCVEAIYAVDCGDHWVVNSASRVNGKHRTYKVKKGSCQGTPTRSSQYRVQGLYLEKEVQL